MKTLYLIVFFSIPCLYGQVGINTMDPQQALHIAHSDVDARLGRMRVESLNSTNNSYNGGDLNGDGLVNNFYPLYVDENGDLTLEYKPLFNSEDIDALDDTNLPTSTVYLPSTDSNANESTNIVSYSIYFPSSAILEIKYTLSFDVYLNTSKDIIIDNLARRVITYLTISGNARTYGRASNNYSSGSVNSVAGKLYNSSTTYITIPSAGTYDLTLVGAVSSNIKANSENGDPAESTYVEFATGHDFVFFRVHK